MSRRRRLALWLPALLVLAATLLGGGRTAAQGEQPLGFVWGPAAPSDLRPPLDNEGVLNALVLAVDADTISARILGGPGLLAYVDDASQPVELSEGWSGFAPERSRIILEEDGVTGVTLTIAGDPDVPVTGQIAEAIASDLRANIGAQVTVVEGDADFVVRQAAPPPTPVPPLPAGTVAFEHKCTPDTVRPDEWVVMECVARTTNTSQDTLTNVGWSVGGTFDGPIPTPFFAWSKRDGEFQPLSTYTLSYGGYDLSPGQTVETSTVLLLRMSEGT
ncbi:MAG: ABC transporter substrate-binding protein, partial [Dehalococcoidia bacterium]